MDAMKALTLFSPLAKGDSGKRYRGAPLGGNSIRPVSYALPRYALADLKAEYD
jgi:hypothetical protein